MPLRIAQLPEFYQLPARRLCRRLLSTYPNTVSLVVIGSVAMGTHDSDSDLDLVWAYRGRRRRHWRDEIDYWHQSLVELVPLNMTQVRTHFRQHSPLAHAIQHGLSLYDPERQHRRWQRLRLGLPTPDWVEETYDFMWYRFEWGMDTYRRERALHRDLRHAAEGCSCSVGEILTRATLNLVRLLLVLAGDVALCKAHMRQLYPTCLHGPRLREAMEITLSAHHQHRDLALTEAREVARLGEWTKRQLVRQLGIPEAEARARKLGELLAP